MNKAQNKKKIAIQHAGVQNPDRLPICRSPEPRSAPVSQKIDHRDAELQATMTMSDELLYTMLTC
jgi:hypothetical protein